MLAWAPSSALLYWGLFWEGPQPPWADAVDFTASETWLKRWQRKTEEWGEEGAQSLCRVIQLPEGAWGVVYEASQVPCLQATPQTINAPWPAAAWREGLEDFCLKMEIKLQPGRWHLVAEKAPDA